MTDSTASDIEITFVNQSTDCGNTKVVIFQKNMLGGIDELPVAWKVLDCESDRTCSFSYPTAVTASANDEDGNAGAPQPVKHGQAFALRRADAGGSVLVPVGLASKPERIEVVHEHGEAPAGVRFYRGGKLMASRQTLMPGGKAVFQFMPALWIGLLPEASEGMLLPPVAPVDLTMLALGGMRAATIRMTGSCTDPARPVRFSVAAG